MGNLATTYSALGRLQDALALQEEKLQFDRRVSTEDNPSLGLTLFNLCSIHAQLGNFPVAKELVHEALRVWQASLPPSHPRIALAREHLQKIQEHLTLSV
jgi:tetratricopeptide (TPR) repeat protein